MASCLKMRKITKNKSHETPFMKNGRLLLEELIAFCDGKCNPIRSFSANGLKKATNNYDWRLRILQDVDYILYEGFFKDCKISVKRYSPLGGKEPCESPFTDIAIGPHMSTHNNVLKLIGCCLETEYPILVYEFVGNETLSEYTRETEQMLPRSPSWKCRIKILVDIANALAYLHIALSTPVIHRDIRPGNIIVDKNYVAKLTDFLLSVSIPDGQSHVEHVLSGKMGYMAPENFATQYLTEKADVFIFGVFVLKVLTRRDIIYGGNADIVRVLSLPDSVRHSVENIKQLIEIVHPNILKEGTEPQELQALAKLALRCMCEEAEDRPTMIKVGRELKQIHRSVPPP